MTDLVYNSIQFLALQYQRQTEHKHRHLRESCRFAAQTHARTPYGYRAHLNQESHLQGILHEQTLYHHILSTARKYCQNKHQKTCLNYKIPPPSQKNTRNFYSEKTKKVLNVKSNQYDLSFRMLGLYSVLTYIGSFNLPSK